MMVKPSLILQVKLLPEDYTEECAQEITRSFIYMAQSIVSELGEDERDEGNIMGMSIRLMRPYWDPNDPKAQQLWEGVMPQWLRNLTRNMSTAMHNYNTVRHPVGAGNIEYSWADYEFDRNVTLRVKVDAENRITMQMPDIAEKVRTLMSEHAFGDKDITLIRIPSQASYDAQLQAAVEQWQAQCAAEAQVQAEAEAQAQAEDRAQTQDEAQAQAVTQAKTGAEVQAVTQAKTGAEVQTEADKVLTADASEPTVEERGELTDAAGAELDESGEAVAETESAEEEPTETESAEEESDVAVDADTELDAGAMEDTGAELDAGAEEDADATEGDADYVPPFDIDFSIWGIEYTDGTIEEYDSRV